MHKGNEMSPRGAHLWFLSLAPGTRDAQPGLLPLRKGSLPSQKFPWPCQSGLPASGRHPELCGSKVGEMVPQALSASRRCQNQSMLISSLGILSFTALTDSAASVSPGQSPANPS